MVDRHIDHVRHRVAQSEGNEPEPPDIPVLPDLGQPDNTHKPSPDPPAKDADPLPPSSVGLASYPGLSHAREGLGTHCVHMRVIALEFQGDRILL